MVKIKICGISNLEDAELAVELGADALGFVFAESPRHISAEVARAIIQSLPPFVSKVGVFVNEEERKVKEIAAICQLDALQFHGEESADYCQKFEQKAIKAFRVGQDFDLSILGQYKVDAYLLDTFAPDAYGGTGKIFDWNIAVEAKKYGRIILSGGLNPENVVEAVRLVQPYAVDVSSGVEAEPGKKDPARMKTFFESIANVR